MPDHLHALLSFARDRSMSEIIRDWKRFHPHEPIMSCGRKDTSIIACDLTNAVRSSQRATNYIRQNPVAALVYAQACKSGIGLSIHSRRISTSPKAMADGSPKAQVIGAMAAFGYQRVEDNAFLDQPDALRSRTRQPCHRGFCEARK